MRDHKDHIEGGEQVCIFTSFAKLLFFLEGRFGGDGLGVVKVGYEVTRKGKRRLVGVETYLHLTSSISPSSSSSSSS